MFTPSVTDNMDNLDMEMLILGNKGFDSLIYLFLNVCQQKISTHGSFDFYHSLRGSPTLVQALPGPSTQVTAGSNHTAVLLMDGQVFTFGSFSVS